MKPRGLAITPSCCGTQAWATRSFLANITEFFKQLCGSDSEFQRLRFEFVSPAIQETRTCEMFF